MLAAVWLATVPMSPTSASTTLGDFPPSSRDLLEVRLSGVLQHQAPDGSGPRESKRVNVHMKSEGLAGHLPESGYEDVQNPVGNSRFGGDLCKSQGRERGLLGRLSTTLFPLASAGASFATGISRGKFHGVMAAPTPIGSDQRAMREVAERRDFSP